MRKFFTFLVALLIAMLPTFAYADAEESTVEAEEPAIEEVVAEEVDDPEVAEAVEPEVIPEVVTEEVDEPEITEDSEAVEEENVEEDTLETEDPKPLKEIIEEDEEDWEYCSLDIAFERAVKGRGNTSVDISDLRIKAEDAEDLAAILSEKYDEFDLVEENGYIVAIIFLTEENSEVLEDEESVHETLTSSVYEPLVLTEIRKVEADQGEEVIQISTKEPTPEREVPAEEPIKDASETLIYAVIAIGAVIKALAALI